MRNAVDQAEERGEDGHEQGELEGEVPRVGVDA